MEAVTYEHELLERSTAQCTVHQHSDGAGRQSSGTARLGSVPARRGAATRHTRAAVVRLSDTRFNTHTLHKTLVNRVHKTFLSDSHLVPNGNVENAVVVIFIRMVKTAKHNAILRCYVRTKF